jgi:hypothetical protein
MFEDKIDYIKTNPRTKRTNKRDIVDLFTILIYSETNMTASYIFEVKNDSLFHNY